MCTLYALLSRTLEGLNPFEILQSAPVQVDNGAHHHDMHYLVAVAPVVKQAGDEALGDLDDVDQPPHYSQSVHDDKETQWVRAAHPAAEHPEQEEQEAEHGLPEEGLQAQDVGAGRGGAVDAVRWQEGVSQQSSLSQEGVAEQGDVDDGEGTWGQEGGDVQVKKQQGNNVK